MGKCRITPLCFVCFKPASAKDGNHEGNYSLEFLQFFTRFLEIPLKIPVQNQDFVCCDDCFEIRESFRDEYFEWEKLRLQLELRVRQLFEIMRAAEKVPSDVNDFQNQPKTKDDGDDESNKAFNVIQKLRNEILRGCKKKLNSSFPRVVLEVIPKEIVRNVSVAAQSVENFKLLHRMMTIIAVFQLSLPQPVTNLHKDKHRVPPTTATIPSVETNSNPLHVIESPEVIDAEVYDCTSEVSETRDETQVPNSCNEAQTGTHFQQHDDSGGQVYEELRNKEHPKFYMEAAQVHHSSGISGNSATLNAGQPEAIGKVFNNTQKPCKLQDTREVRKKWLRAAKRASSRFTLTRRIRCRKSFYKHTSVHQKTHSDKRPFKCTTCESCFRRKDALSVHMREKHRVDNLRSSETVNNTSLSGELAPAKAIKISNNKRKLQGSHLSDLQQPHSKSSSSLPVPGKHGSTPQISDSRHFRCVICQKSFPTRYRLTRHSATHSGKRPFKCTCGSCFRTLDVFSKHIKEAYQQDKSNHQLVRQLTTKKGERSFNCTSCGASFNANSSLTRHNKIVHGVDYLHSSETVKNPSLGGELTPPTAIEISNREQKPEGEYQPDLQQPHSKSSSSLPVPGNLSNTPQISDSRRFRCGTCQKSFSTRYDMTRHSSTHSGKCPFKCTCGSSFRSKRGFSNHIKETYQHDNGSHQLVRQLATKKGERSFSCTTCGASFNANSSLTRHIATVHRVDNLHSSETVNKFSFSSGELTPPTAIMIINSERKLEEKHQPDLQQPHSKSSSLPILEKRSSTPKISDSRRFRCLTCRKSFPTRYDLTTHSATHSRKLPFKCTCGSCFKTMDGFSKHIKSAYQLDKSNHQLDRKLMTQTGEHSFNCTTCGASFKWSSSLTRHIKIVHNADKKVEILDGMVNLAAGGSTQGKTGSAPEEKKMTVTNIEEESNGMKNYCYKCHECPYQGKDRHRFQSHRQLHEDGSDVVVCSFCGWYLRPTSLTVHQKLHHP